MLEKTNTCLDNYRNLYQVDIKKNNLFPQGNIIRFLIEIHHAYSGLVLGDRYGHYIYS